MISMTNLFSLCLAFKHIYGVERSPFVLRLLCDAKSLLVIYLVLFSFKCYPDRSAQLSYHAHLILSTHDG